MQWFIILTDWLDKGTIWVATVTMVFTLINWRYNRKQQEDVVLVLHCGPESLTLPLTVKRRYCTRAEVQGILGAIYGEGRYIIPFLAKKEFSRRLELVQESKDNCLHIDVDLADVFQVFQKNVAATAAEHGSG